MHSEHSTHPDRYDLLLYVDGEMPFEKAAGVKAHLEACWSCRLRAEQLQETILSFAEFCDSVLTPSAGPPPREWKTFDAKLRGVVEETGRASLVTRLHKFLFSWRAAATLGTATITLLLIVRFQHLPVASASQLLQRATESRATSLRMVRQPVIYQKLHIRAGKAQVTREVWQDTVNRRVKDTWVTGRNHLPGLANSRNATEAMDLPRLFAANRLDWQDPLSAAGFAHWRSGAGDKVDQVARDGDQLTLKTTIIPGAPPGEGISDAGAGKVVAASLTVRASDYHPIAENLTIECGEKRLKQDVELSELEYEVVGLPAVGEALFAVEPAEMERVAGNPGRPVSAPSSPAVLVPELSDAEMAARFALHRVGADLGEQIEIQMDAGQNPRTIRVQGLVASVERKRLLQAVLENIPHVSMRLQTEDEAAAAKTRLAPEDVASGEAKVVSAHSPIEKQLLEYCGDGVGVEKFSKQSFAATQALMAEAWALRHLTERYPDAAQLELTASSRQLLREMVRDHRRVMRERAAELTALLRPLLLSISGLPQELPAPDSLFSTAQQVERLAMDLLSGSERQDSTDTDQPARAARDLLAALTALEIQLGDE